jgi:ATP-dependent Clp protease ATP-binding subunit ClpA
VFEDGQLTDGLGNTVDFKNTIIIMTSNLGARFLDKKNQMGFAPAAEASGVPPRSRTMVMGEVKRAFNPEFLNRLDEVILFTSLTDDDLLKIIDLLVDQINQNLVAKQIKIRLTEDAAKYILEKTCTDRSYGARPLRRALQKYIEDPLSELLIQGMLLLEIAVAADRHRDRAEKQRNFQHIHRLGIIDPLPEGRFWRGGRWRRLRLRRGSFIHRRRIIIAPLLRGRAQCEAARHDQYAENPDKPACQVLILA